MQLTLIIGMRPASKRPTIQLVDMECGYLTIDFLRKIPQDVEIGENSSHSIFDRYSNANLRRVGNYN